MARSLSKADIHTLVEGGCPKLQRKVVNSAKRLRVYVGLEEKSVSRKWSEAIDNGANMLTTLPGGDGWIG
ncbi:hypothetical protein RDABS01_017207 [Bienertia sinuspersici]